MKLIFIYGPPAVGKLTVAKELEKSTGFKLFHNHLIADLITPIFGLRTTAAKHLQLTINTLIFETAAKNNLPGLIRTFVYYDDLATHRSLLSYREALRPYNAEIFFIKLAASTEKLMERVVNHSRQTTKKIASTEKLEKVLQTENVTSTIPENIAKSLVIDNSNIPPEEVVARIKSYCGTL